MPDDKTPESGPCLDGLIGNNPARELRRHPADGSEIRMNHDVKPTLLFNLGIVDLDLIGLCQGGSRERGGAAAAKQSAALKTVRSVLRHERVARDCPGPTNNFVPRSGTANLLRSRIGFSTKPSG